MHWSRTLALAVAGVACCATVALGGGGPQNVLVVINDQSIESQEVGLRYAAARGIPGRNICRVSVPPSSAAAANHNMSSATFQTSIVDRIHQHIAAHGLSNQIDYIVLCQDLPTRVGDNEGASSVLFYGFKNAPLINNNADCAAVATTGLPPYTASAYYKAERGFNHADPYGGTNYFLSFLLIADRLSVALSNVDRNVSADGTAPTGHFYLVTSGDPARNIRYRLFDNFDFHARFINQFPSYEYVYPGPINQKTNVMGFMWGDAQINDRYNRTNLYLQGSMADHLTSHGGRFPTDQFNQGKAWEWIAKGVGASYGTVREPCAFLEKFPDPLVYYWYARGFSAGETYWMSVANPYQGVFLGDPLTAPYAAPPAVAITNLTPAQTVTGTMPVWILATANAAGEPVARVDVYVDGLFAGCATNVPPRSGNVLRVTIAGQPATYTAGVAETLYSAVTNLAGRVNASNLPVRAFARGDRLELVYTNFGFSGTGIAYSATTETGTASELTIHAEALGSNLLESAYVAREYIQLRAYGNKANTGDTVTCVITLTNGVVATNVIVAAQNEAPSVALNRLMHAINNNPALQVTNGVFANPHTYNYVSSLPLEARRPGPEGTLIHVVYAVSNVTPGSGLFPGDSFSDNFDDNQNDLTARGNVLFRCGKEPLETSWSWDTTQWPNGPHTIRAVARIGSGPETQGHTIIPVVISNAPLSCRVVSPTNGEPFILGDDIFVQAEATNESGSITQMVFEIESKPHTTMTNAPFVMSFSSLDYGVGTVAIRARAWDGAGARAVSAPVNVEIARSPTLDTDGDDVADSWEQRHFGGLYIYGSTNDPDGDLFPNSLEYIADTDPNDSASIFSLSVGADTGAIPSISFFASTARVYQVRYSSQVYTNMNDWQAATPTSFVGGGSVTNWMDDGGKTTPPAEQVTQRVYRVRAAVPD